MMKKFGKDLTPHRVNYRALPSEILNIEEIMPQHTDMCYTNLSQHA